MKNTPPKPEKLMAKSEEYSSIFHRIYEDYKEMGIDLSPTIADATVAYVTRHENPKEVSSEVIAQWVDQNTEVDVSPDFNTEDPDTKAETPELW